MICGNRVFSMTVMCVVSLASLTGCNSKSAAEGACRDMVTAFGDKAEECGFDRRANESAAERSITGSVGCGSVRDVRDIDSFYGGCIPFVRRLTCEQFNSSDTVFPASCVGQLITR